MLGGCEAGESEERKRVREVVTEVARRIVYLVLSGVSAGVFVWYLGRG